MNPLPRLAAALALLAGCNGSVVPNDYVGEPVFTMRGHVTGNSVLVTDANRNRLRATLLWMPKGTGAAESFDELLDQPSTSIRVAASGSFEWNLFDEPEDRAFVTTASGARWALARPVVYDDIDGDGVKDSNEPVVGLAPRNLVLRNREPLAAADSPSGVDVPAGFHLVSKPIGCVVRPVPRPSGGTCGISLGAPCIAEDPATCAGTCLLDQGIEWPGGYCTVTEESGSCRPDGSVLFKIPRAPMQVWLKGCDSDADCADRTGPYHCDFTYRACLPTADVGIVLANQSAPVSVCNEPPPAPPPPPP